HRDGAVPAWLAVFQETHTSRIGQVEIALMLYRLHRDHRMRHIALEGYVSGTAVDAAWFHRIPGPPSVRQRVALQLLEDGEVSAAEFVALLFPDVALNAIEDPKLYSVEIPKDDSKKVAACMDKIVQGSVQKDEHQRELRALAASERANY